MEFEEFIAQELADINLSGVRASISQMRLQDALEQTNKLLSENSNYLLRELKAYLLLAMHKDEDAIFMLKEMLRSPEVNSHAYYFYGVALKNLNFPWEACRYFEKAQGLGHPKAEEQLGNTRAITKVAEEKAVQLIAFKEVPEKYRCL